MAGHQTWEINPNSGELVIDSTCASYDSTNDQSSMMEGGRDIFTSTESLLLYSLLITGVTAFSLALLMGVVPVVHGSAFNNKMTTSFFFLAVTIMSITSLILQKEALHKVEDVCNESYLPNEMLFYNDATTNSPKIRFVNDCEVGPDGNQIKQAIAFCGIAAGAAFISAAVMMIQNHHHKIETFYHDGKTCCDEDEDDGRIGVDDLSSSRQSGFCLDASSSSVCDVFPVRFDHSLRIDRQTVEHDV